MCLLLSHTLAGTGLEYPKPAKPAKPLLQNLVEELPKRGGWPEGASHAGYKRSQGVVSFTKGGAPGFNGDNLSILTFHDADEGARWMIGPDFLCEKPVDYATAIITRDQYAEALRFLRRHEGATIKNLHFEGGRLKCEFTPSVPPENIPVTAVIVDADGWIEWHGGECPVPVGTLVDVKYLCGKENRHVGAGLPFDNTGSYPLCNANGWEKNGRPYSIIAYRLHQPQDINSRANDDRLAQELAAVGLYDTKNGFIEEADLNDCIGQAPVDLDQLSRIIVEQISFCAPEITVGAATKIAQSLVDAGYRKQ